MMLPQIKMKTVLFLISLGFLLQDTSAVFHSLYYYYTESSGIPDFPEFMAVGFVDDLQIDHYDSNTKRAEPKQDWMYKVRGNDPNYWERITEVYKRDQQDIKANIETESKGFNQTGDVHIIQNKYGCEWDDETGVVNVYDKYGYDGEDFIELDVKSMTYVPLQQRAGITTERLNNDRGFLGYKYYLTIECPMWLKKYVEFGKSFLMRKDLPTVSIFQKTPSSQITCHATGFYPDRAALFWRKDGEELHDNVVHGKILPNHDGSFQMSVDLELPSDDWGKYECVFQLSGVKTDLVTKLDNKDIKTNYVNSMNMVIGISASVLLIVIITYTAGFWMKINNKRRPSPVNSPAVELQPIRANQRNSYHPELAVNSPAVELQPIRANQRNSYHPELAVNSPAVELQPIRANQRNSYHPELGGAYYEYHVCRMVFQRAIPDPECYPSLETYKEIMELR